MDEMMGKQTILCALDEIEAEVTSWKRFFRQHKVWLEVDSMQRETTRACWGISGYNHSSCREIRHFNLVFAERWLDV